MRAEGIAAFVMGDCKKKKKKKSPFGVTVNPANHKCMGCPKSFFHCCAPLQNQSCVGLLLVWLASGSDSLRPSLQQPVNMPSTGMTPRKDGRLDSVCRKESAEFKERKKETQTCLCLCDCRRGTTSLLHLTSRVGSEESVCHIVDYMYICHKVNVTAILRHLVSMIEHVDDKFV